MKFVFYDRFRDEYTTERDAIAPPERYINIHCGFDDFIFIETYSYDDKTISVSYTAAEREAGTVEHKRKYYFSLAGFVFEPFLQSWTIPKKEFEKIINDNGLKPIEI